MTRWEYRELIWNPEQVTVTVPHLDDEPTVEAYTAAEWPALLARFGYEGWEMVNCTASPAGIHEYYFYFKRPLED